MSQPPTHRTTEFAAYAKQLLGRVVREAGVGVGSMITIQVEHTAQAPLTDKVWVQLTEWALLEGEAEVVASDLPDAEFQRLKDRVAVLIGRMVLNMHLFDDGEFHLDFSGHYRLEMWPNTEAYGAGADLVSLFAAGEHVATLTA